MKKSILFYCMAMLCATLCYAQQQNHKYPEVGKPCPDFIFNDVQGYSQNKVSLTDLKGKYVILDFWSKSCGACISLFPEVNKLQQQFKDKLQFFLVGYDEKGIRPLFERVKKTQGLKLSVAFDTTTMQNFIPPHTGIPHEVWIDKEGIVRAVTEGEALTAENISAFINDKSFSFYDVSFKGQHKTPFKYKSPILINGNGGNDTSFLFRSILAEWKQGMPYINPLPALEYVKRSPEKLFLLQFSGIPLNYLYNYAYLGSPAPDEASEYSGEETSYWPILNLRDTSFFINDKNASHTGLYVYGLNVEKSKASRKFYMNVMQSDLKNYFGYDVSFEHRKVPCYILVVTDKTKLPYYRIGSKKKKEEWIMSGGGTLYDQPMSEVKKILAYAIPNGFHFYDETGIKDNLNLDFVATINWKNLPIFNKTLNSIGLEIRRSEKLMRVMVISDPK